MLRSLSIRDFVIVDRLDLEFGAGFTALTGETGAGKSILIDALMLALGERADPLAVRQGAERAEVAAEFEIGRTSDIAAWLDAQDLAGDDAVVLVRRVIEAGGRSRGFINGHAATAGQLKSAGEFLLDVHGQNQHQSLARAATQRALVDAFGGLAERAARVANAWRAWQARRETRIAFESGAAAYAAERERLEWQVRDLEALRPGADDWAAVTAEHARLAHAASLIEAAQFGVDTLSEGENATLAQIHGVMARLSNLVAHDSRLQEVIDVLDPARIQLQEAVYALRRYGERTELDPQRLREVEQRLDALHSAARKYRVPPDELAAVLERASARLAELATTGDAASLLKAEQDAHAACVAEAKQLTAGRRRAVRKFSEAVTAAMQDLALAGGTFEAVLEPVSDVSAHGLETVSFRVSAHKGMPPQPLARVASGGELSRLSLAVQTVASQVAQVPTLIFDEVDAGIGGRVAEIVGRMLRTLGRRHQVMCITHLPQVAAAADQQWQVAKSTVNGRTLSTLTVLDAGARVEEVARMLGGVKITETTRRHAAEMLGAKR